MQRLLLGGDLDGQRLGLPVADRRIRQPGFDLAGVVGEGKLQTRQCLPIGLPLFLQGGQADLLLREDLFPLLQIDPERIPPLLCDGHLPLENCFAFLQGLQLRLMPGDPLPGFGRLRTEILPVEFEDLEALRHLARLALVPFHILFQPVDPQFREVELGAQPEEFFIPLGDQ